MERSYNQSTEYLEIDAYAECFCPSQSVRGQGVRRASGEPDCRREPEVSRMARLVQLFLCASSERLYIFCDGERATTRHWHRRTRSHRHGTVDGPLAAHGCDPASDDFPCTIGDTVEFAGFVADSAAARTAVGAMAAEAGECREDSDGAGAVGIVGGDAGADRGGRVLAFPVASSFVACSAPGLKPLQKS